MTGQQAYERDVEKRPFYHDGTARPTWYDLGPIARYSWERPAPVPTPDGAAVPTHRAGHDRN